MTAPRDMRELLAVLEAAGELRRVAAPADPQLEIAAIIDRVCKRPGGGPALYFERPTGYAAPVLANLFGSPRRMGLALGVTGLDDLGARLGAALAAAGPGDGWQRLERLLAEPGWQPRLLADGPCREVGGGADLLDSLPALHAWPGDGGSYLTLPLVFTRHPENGEVNCGMYRLQLFSDGCLGLHLAPGADAARHLAAWAERGEAMPVAVALGGPPALLFAAGLPLPPGLAETALAGWLQGEALDLVTTADSGLAVPALAEYSIEGEIRPGETRLEGPFGNHSGRYVPAEPAPLLRVQRVGRRRRPLYPCTVVGPPPMEDCWLAKAAERLLLPLLQSDFPEVVDWNLPIATIFHGAALVSAQVPADGGRDLLKRLRRHSLLARALLLVLFDAHVDVQDAAGCYWRAVNGAEPDRDLTVAGNRLSIDATGSDPAAGGRRGRRHRSAARCAMGGAGTGQLKRNNQVSHATSQPGGDSGFLPTLLPRSKRVRRRPGPQPIGIALILQSLPSVGARQNRRVSSRQTSYFSDSAQKSNQKSPGCRRHERPSRWGALAINRCRVLRAARLRALHLQAGVVVPAVCEGFLQIRRSLVLSF